MAKYIDKDVLVAEIERRMKKYTTVSKESDAQYRIKYHTLMSILSFLDTLEESTNGVKEVDLEKEIHLWMEDNACGGYCSANIRETAEHFFELGLKAQKGE